MRIVSKRFTFLLVIFVYILDDLVSSQTIDEQWRQFQVKFNKKYPTQVEATRRFFLFLFMNR